MGEFKSCTDSGRVCCSLGGAKVVVGGGCGWGILLDLSCSTVHDRGGWDVARGGLLGLLESIGDLLRRRVDATDGELIRVWRCCGERQLVCCRGKSENGPMRGMS